MIKYAIIKLYRLESEIFVTLFYQKFFTFFLKCTHMQIDKTNSTLSKSTYRSKVLSAYGTEKTHFCC